MLFLCSCVKLHCRNAARDPHIQIDAALRRYMAAVCRCCVVFGWDNRYSLVDPAG